MSTSTQSDLVYMETSKWYNGLIPKCESLVQELVSKNDVAHDFSHIDRVRKMALSIAHAEGIHDLTSLFVIELAALLHDVNDWKLNMIPFNIALWLHSNGIQEKWMVNRILFAITYTSYRLSLRDITTTSQTTPLEAKIVRDADRLDSIGAIGIARAYSYGSKKNNPLYCIDRLDILEQVQTTPLPTESEYVQSSSASSSTTLDHFRDKLLRLSTLMETTTARKLAKERHAFMEQFVIAMKREINESS